MFFLTIIIRILPANNAFGCRYQATVPVGPFYSYDGNASKTIIAVFSPGTVSSPEKLILTGLLFGKRSSIFHCVIKQFLNSPAYFSKTLTEVCHAAIVVVDSYYINIPVVKCFKVWFFPNGPQKFSALPSNFIHLFLWKTIGNHQLTLLFHIPGILLKDIKIIAEVLHFLFRQVIDFCLALIDDQPHISGKIVGHAISKALCVLIVLTQYQDVVGIPYMDTDFQIGSFQITPYMPFAVKLRHIGVMPAVSLVPEPDIEPMEIHIADERTEDRPLRRTLRVLHFTGLFKISFLDETIDIIENYLILHTNVP